MIGRRHFVLGLGSAAAGVWDCGIARGAGVPLVGFLNSQSLAGWEHFVAAFERGLQNAGFSIGRTVEIAYHWAEGDPARLAPLLAALLARNPSAITVTGGPDPAIAAKRATSTVPVVFTTGADPVQLGLVASLSRPGGNMTGFTLFTRQLNPKRLEILGLLSPSGAPVAALFNPANSGSQAQLSALRQAADLHGAALIEAQGSSPDSIERSLAAAKAAGAKSVFVGSDAYFYANRRSLIDLMAKLALPAIYEGRDFVTDGGLVSYGVDFASVYESVGLVVGQILKGSSPATLPVQQPSKMELVVNLKAARELQLAVPPALLLRADEVIE